MITAHDLNDLKNPTYAASLLGVPEETIIKLRRGLDPDLSFDEHNAVFPLDLGPVRNMEAFGAIKNLHRKIPITPGPHTKFRERGFRAWEPVYDQIAAFFRIGLEQACWPCRPGDRAEFDDSLPQEDGSQRGTYIHVDAGEAHRAFKENWRPPEAIIIIARAEEPNTLFIKGYEHMPQDMVDVAKTEELAAKKSYSTLAPEKDDGTLELVVQKITAFHSEKFLRKAEADGTLVRIPAGRMVAITNRSLHAGQPSIPGKAQNFARGQLCVRPAAPA